MKSIQTKFIILILSCVIVCTAVIGGAGVLNSGKAVEEDSARIMNLMCSEKAKELDALLSRIKQSVETLAVYALGQLESAERLIQDGEYREEYTRQVETVAINAAGNTEGAVAVYLRFNPESTPPTSGLFWSKTALNGTFQQLTPTDFSSYSPEDIEHVGWYYLPVKSGKAIWMNPYLNQNINVYMISYVIPLYKNNETVGVVGMDIDFDVITESVAKMQLYESGYAFLADADGTLRYHKELTAGLKLSGQDQSLSVLEQELKNGTSGSFLVPYKWKGQSKKAAFRSLSNGMKLIVTAPVSEIDSARNRLILQIGISCLIIMSLSLILTLYVTRRIIKPLKELNEAAKKIAGGDLNIPLVHQTRDEVGTLAESFRQTVRHLQKYIDYINGLAYRDSATGVKNKTAYQEAVKRLEEKMRLERPAFAVLVLDINNLKLVNDNYGHDFGDMLIMDACRLLSGTFKRSPVYRIGGDEFVVILENGDYEHYSELLSEFQTAIDCHNRDAGKDSQLSIARGIAIYNPDSDLVFGNIFKRADEAMYQNKAVMKKKLAEEGQETDGR